MWAIFQAREIPPSVFQNCPKLAQPENRMMKCAKLKSFFFSEHVAAMLTSSNFPTSVCAFVILYAKFLPSYRFQYCENDSE